MRTTNKNSSAVVEAIPADTRQVKSGRSVAMLACTLAGAIATFSSWNSSAQPVDRYGSDAGMRLETKAPESGWGVQLGYNSDFRRAALVYETPPVWSHRFPDGWGRLDLDLELGVSYWDARRGKLQTMWQLSAIPILRWWPNDGFFIEAGVGPTVLTRPEFAGRDLGTRFQFGSYLGAGFMIQDRHRIGIRYSHYSNANITKPNSGLDIFQLTYAYRF
jgi:lipid A 3-O-deacylase